jgi:hypothetical protein
VLCLATFRLGGTKGVFDAVRGAAVMALVLVLPFVFASRMESLTATVAGASSWYPYISMNAHNVWWLVGGVQSVTISDAMRLGNGVLTYHALGTLLLGGATGLILWRLWRDLSRADGEVAVVLCEAMALQLLAFYLFPTQMHERYIVPALVFLGALCIWKPAAWWVYALCSVGVVVSLASTLNATYALSARYPLVLGRVVALLPENRAETTALSALFVVLFGVLLFGNADRVFRWVAPLTAGVVAVLITGIALVPLRRAEHLWEWEPVEQSQEWGTMQHNRSVDGHRLSVVGFIFRHGIGTHAASKITYHLNGAFRTLDTAFAIDDEANRGQQARFRVLADGEVRFDSGNIAGFSFPRHVAVPVEGARFITLEVLDGGDGINFDHADWLEPELLR